MLTDYDIRPNAHTLEQNYRVCYFGPHKRIPRGDGTFWLIKGWRDIADGFATKKAAREFIEQHRAMVDADHLKEEGR